MKSYFYVLFGLMLLVSCSKEQDVDNGIDKIPEQVFGSWLYTVDENDEYYFCQGLSLSSVTGYWQITQQEYNDLATCGGTMRYDENTQTLYLNCSKDDREHVKLNGNEITAIKIISFSNDKLTVCIAGDTIEYSRNNESYIIPNYEWTNGYDDNLNPAGSIPDSVDTGVDLGLSVFWAEYNMGADDNNRVGGCYGWGDVTGTCYSENEERYPNSNPPSDISGSEYDIVTKKWGNGWRIPTKEEVQELIDNCFITWSNWRKSWEFTSKINGNKIILPAAQVRCGKSTFYDECGYWTSTLDVASEGAYALFIPEIEGDIINSISCLKRSYGLQIRPVKDKN